MNIFLDGTEITQLHDFKNSTVKEVYTFLYDMCLKENKTIKQVLVDGKELKAEDIDSFLKKNIEEMGQIEFFSITGESILNNLCALGNSFILISKEFENISIILNEGKDDKALSIIQEFSIMLHNLYIYYGFFDIAGIPATHLFEGKTIATYQAEISPLLNDIVNAFAQKDTVAISDITEYELAPITLSLGKGLVALIELR